MGKISTLGSWYLNRACLLTAWELDLVRMVSCRSDTPLGLVKRVCPGCCSGHCGVWLISPFRAKALPLSAAGSVGSCQLSADPSPVPECPTFVVAASQLKSSPCLALLPYSCWSEVFPSKSTHKGSWGAQPKTSNFKLAFQCLYAT